jgi:hypothetical protein
MVATVTVKDIAERIRREDENLTNVIDRLRNWTKEGLLSAAGDKHPGTGRSRHYPSSAILEALLLTVLTDAVGMPATKARAFAAAFDLAKKWLKSDPGTSHLMVIGRSRDQGPPEIHVIRRHALLETLGDSPHEAQIVIDLGKVYASLNVPVGATV